MPLRSRLLSVARPTITTDRDLITYVIRVVILCATLAVALDVLNQLTFFIDWQTSVRSWVISAIVASVIAAPVAFGIGRTHLELYRAKLVVEELSRTDPLTGLLNRRALLSFDEGPIPKVMALVIADIDVSRRSMTAMAIWPETKSSRWSVTRCVPSLACSGRSAASVARSLHWFQAQERPES